MSALFKYSLIFCALLAISPSAWAQPVLISEFLASNDDGLADEDGDFEDWIELFNRSEVSVNLGGWYLTDDPEDLTKWRFPDVEMQRGDYLVVFASGKDRRDAATNLHTNFRLDSAGEFLGLVRPDDTFSSAFPQFPRHLPDASYGFPMETVATEILAQPLAKARYFVPRRSIELDADWNENDFDDSASA